MYIAKYLPVDRPWTDGCIMIDAQGNHKQWDESGYEAEAYKQHCKVAELFIVEYEYNLLKIVGKPNASAMKWIKPGMEFKHFNVEATEQKVYHGNIITLGENCDYETYCPIVNITCEVCGHAHVKAAATTDAPSGR